ncbi:tRNA intron endonuclease [Chlamydoabsidia padenii]|nr:tRNA intron endonuclease [Chlamydoabsidia padenii]
MADLLKKQYDQVQTMALAFPGNSDLIIQVYKDLALNKQWKNIQPIAIDDLQICILRAHEPLGEWLTIVPIRYDQELSMEMIARTFGYLDKANLTSTSLKKITFGIVTRDSTVLYYHISKGLIPPKEL